MTCCFTLHSSDTLKMATVPCGLSNLQPEKHIAIRVLAKIIAGFVVTSSPTLGVMDFIFGFASFLNNPHRPTMWRLTLD